EAERPAVAIPRICTNPGQSGMVWSEITCRHCGRKGWRHESVATDVEWFVMEPLLPPVSALQYPRKRPANAGRRDPFHRVHPSPMAAIAARAVVAQIRIPARGIGSA